MIGSLITSQTRIKLLKKFFLNSNTSAHLRGLESEFGESTNAIRIELNRLENAGLLNSTFVGNKKIFQANQGHPLFKDIHNIIIKEAGIDRLVEKVIHRIGNLDCIYLTGDLAKGKDSGVMEIILVGGEVDRNYLSQKVHQAESIIGRKVNYTFVNSSEAEIELEHLNPCELLLLWSDNRGG